LTNRWTSGAYHSITCPNCWPLPPGEPAAVSIFCVIRNAGNVAAGEIGQGLRERRAPQHAGCAPFADLERPAEARCRFEVELGPPLEDDLRDAEVFTEVKLLAAPGREDVHVLVDSHEHVDAVGSDPLVAYLVDRPLGARLVGGRGRHDEPQSRRDRQADRERDEPDQTLDQRRA
jgi:hypothetical protein